MSMTIGRCSITEDPDAGTLRQRGDEVSFSSVINASSVDEMKARVQQLRGLMDNDDETVFPFTWSEDSSFDGFYTDVQVEVADMATMLTAGACPFTLTMRRVGGFTAPQFECIATTVALTNPHGLPTIAFGMVAVPYTSLLEASGPRTLAGVAGGFFASGATYTTDDGLVRWTVAPTGTPFRFVWATPPAYYYEGSARFEQSFGGTYYPLHGQQVRPIASAWRVSNGLVRVTLTSSAISVSHYDGSAWDTAKLWTLGTAVSGLLLQGLSAVRVIRNTPEEVIVRCVLKMETTVSSTTMDISLRRGMRFASFSLTSEYPASDWYINASPNEAGTALTGGFRATATDASGNRYVVGSPSAQTNNLANGRLKLTTSAQSFQFVIGADVGGVGAGEDQQILNMYAQSIVENHRVVLR